MTDKPARTPPKYDGRCRDPRENPPGSERQRSAPPAGRPSSTPPPIVSTGGTRSRLTIGFFVGGLALFAMIRLVGAGDSGAARDSIEGRIADFERGKSPEQINYNDPVYGKAVEDLRAMANGPDGSAEAERMLRSLEAKQRDFEVRMRQNQAQMEAQLRAQEVRLQEEIEAQRQATGTDPEAAQRLNEQSDKTCLEDGGGKHKHSKATPSAH